MRQALQHAGIRVIGPSHDHESSLQSLAETDLMCAILGFDLQGAMHSDIAKALQQKRVPIIIVRSDFSRVIPEDFLGCPVLHKPVDLYTLLKLVAEISVSDGAPSLGFS